MQQTPEAEKTLLERLTTYLSALGRGFQFPVGFAQLEIQALHPGVSIPPPLGRRGCGCFCAFGCRTRRQHRSLSTPSPGAVHELCSVPGPVLGTGTGSSQRALGAPRAACKTSKEKRDIKNKSWLWYVSYRHFLFAF